MNVCVKCPEHLELRKKAKAPPFRGKIFENPKYLPHTFGMSCKIFGNACGYRYEHYVSRDERNKIPFHVYQLIEMIGKHANVGTKEPSNGRILLEMECANIFSKPAQLNDFMESR